jgi:hypothetical protein
VIGFGQNGGAQAADIEKPREWGEINRGGHPPNPA